MLLIKNENIINIMEKTLNHVDPRLMGHGTRVAYLIYKILEPQRQFEGIELRDICILAMLHDVGAYKTEEIDKMVIFETIDFWEHSIYGYLFLKYFSPLRELAPAILFHHADCNEVRHLDDPAHQKLAHLISLCDRADIFALQGGVQDYFIKYIDRCRKVKYLDEVVDMYLASSININTVFDSMDADKDFKQVLHNISLSVDDVSGYIAMIVCSIDFRSHQTVIHTNATACIATYLARLIGASEDEIEKVKTGAMLHDIGKIGIPDHILEGTKKLDDAEMEIMKTHVDIGEDILEGNVDEEIKRIALRHHEKLNGSGYSKKLTAKDLTAFERTLAVADIFSALCGVRSYKNALPKEKIVKILTEMADQNLIDKEIATLAINHYDKIIEQIDIESKPIIQAYNDINNERQKIKDSLMREVASL